MMAAYWKGVLESGVLPADGDSVMIPIMNGFIMTLLFSPVFALVLWGSLRRYPGRVPIFAKPIGVAGWVWTAFFAIISAWTIAFAVIASSFHFSGLLAVHTMFALSVMFQLRSVAVSRRYFTVIPA